MFSNGKNMITVICLQNILIQGSIFILQLLFIRSQISYNRFPQVFFTNIFLLKRLLFFTRLEHLPNSCP